MDREERDMRARVKAEVATLRIGLFLCVVAGLLFLAAPASAKKTHLFLETFGSASQPSFVSSTSLAIDRSNGDLLVLDPHRKTLNRFKPNGEPDPFPALGTNVIDAKKGPGGKACAEEAESCDQTPQNGFTASGFAGEVQIAVDSSGTVTDGDIYVTQGYQEAGNVVDIFASSGKYLGQLTGAGATKFGSVGTFPFSPCGLAVDEEGDLYVAGGHDDRIYKFDPLANPPVNADNAATFLTAGNHVCSLAAGTGPSAGTLFAAAPLNAQGEDTLFKINVASGTFEGTIFPGAFKAVAVEPATGHLFALSSNSSSENLFEFTASGALSSKSLGGTGRGIAVGDTGQIYESSQQDDSSHGELGSPNILVRGPLVTIPDVSTETYEIKGDTSVRVTGAVNPDGQALEECLFEYVDAAHFQQLSKNPYAEGDSVPCEAPNSVEVGSGASPVEVHADLTGLEKEGTYHYRLVADNHNRALYPNDPAAIVRGKDRIFQTPSKPAIRTVWSQDIVTADAVLKATVNPGNSQTTYRFEWGLDPSYGDSTVEFPLGSGNADHTVSFQLSGLQPATSYHYRLVAMNGIGVSESTDGHFTTFAPPAPVGGCPNEASRLGLAAFLPDCRAYEMVSPLDKGGSDIFVKDTNLNDLSVLERSSEAGDRLAFGSLRAFGDAVSAPWTTQYLAQRVEGSGWQTHSITPPRGETHLEGVFAQADTEFKYFSPDLCDAWLAPFGEPPLSAGAVTGYINFYRRSDRLCGPEGYEALAPLAPPQEMPAQQGFLMQLQGVSADGSEAVIKSNGKLTAEGTPGFRQLYLASPNGGLRFVCVLPDGRVAGLCTAGSAVSLDPDDRAISVANAISADGHRVFWLDSSDGNKLYVRENPAQPESARLHGAAIGTGDLIGPVVGTGNVISGSELVKGAKAESGGFVAGQKITDSNGGIPASTTIVKVEETAAGVFTLTLSAKATKTKLGDSLTGDASVTVTNVTTGSGAFAVGQEISAGKEAIAKGTTIVSCSPSCGPGATSLTLSAKAAKTVSGDALIGSSECTEVEEGKACTFAVSEGAEEEAGTHGSFFWGASRDGGSAVFTTFPPGGNSQTAAVLCEFDIDSGTTHVIAKGVAGVLGMSEDAKRIYFGSREALAAGATAGQPNLYLYEAGEGGSIAFIAALANDDVIDWSETRTESPLAPWSPMHSARVSPDGAFAAFSSLGSLTGYDNHDVATGKASREVYIYDAGAGKLLCASCNPSGGRPSAFDGPALSAPFAARIPPNESSLQASRVLSEDGKRLIFESADALTSRDTNGVIDVYEWEAPGAGSCEESSSDYSIQDEGCIDLISSGQSHLDSRFVEVDPAGANVFFATGSSLLPQDPGLTDIYDAREGGGLPIPSGPPTSCEGESCQSTPEAPNDPTPASESFEGAGNVKEAPLAAQPKLCNKGKVRRHGKCVAKKHLVKRHHKRAKRDRRAGR